MDFVFDHVNLLVTDMERSVAFYEKTLGMKVIREMGSADGPVHFVCLGYEGSDVVLELKQEKAHEGPYNLGDNSHHFCVKTPDIEEALALYREMGIIVREMGGHGAFIKDPDGYEVEVLKK